MNNYGLRWKISKRDGSWFAVCEDGRQYRRHTYQAAVAVVLLFGGTMKDYFTTPRESER